MAYEAGGLHERTGAIHMRYDKTVYFQRPGSRTYNPETGNYERGAPIETERLASVMDTQTETMILVYGEIRQGSKMVHIQNRYDGPLERVRIGSKIYRVDFKRELGEKQSFVLSEVQ